MCCSAGAGCTHTDYWHSTPARSKAGSDAGGERAAAIYSLCGTAKLNGLDQQAYLRYVLERIAEHPSNRIDELLPWHVAARLAEPTMRAAA